MTPVEEAIHARDAADSARDIAREKMARAVRLLLNDGVTYREAGKMLGISHQRIAQIAEADR